MTVYGFSYEYSYVDGKYDGWSESYYDNGQLRNKEYYKDGKEEGVHEAYSYFGEVIYSYKYKDGEIVSD